MKLSKQEAQVHIALLKGESVDWKWGSNQLPPVADGMRICRKLKQKGYDVKDRIIKTKNSWFKQFYYEIHSL